MSSTQSVSAPALTALIARLFVATGVPQPAAHAVADGLVEADQMGLHSHGVMLTEMYVQRLLAGSVATAEAATLVSDRGVTMVLDAGHALGQVTGDQAMHLAVGRAKELGAGIVAVRHGFHFGAARRFAVAAAEADCVGIVACNTRPLMPAPGGAEAIVGNNPLAIAIPTDDDVPLVLDMATSEAAMGKIRMAAQTGGAIPAGWAVDAEGVPTTDPEAAVRGMLLPASGPKGFGLAVMLDLLSGILSGGAAGTAVRALYQNDRQPYDCSHLFIAIDFGHFGDPATLRGAVTAYAARIREGRRAPGVDRLYLPGEPEWQRRQDAGGRVALPDAVRMTLLRLARELGVDTGELFNPSTEGSTNAQA
ncbi:Ldh family oxidoreductase [Devosia sp.]|uniref:Ldh family oxidoreductase n=1 Tax=Devosia sp. TaxID=1871048 RepID=UPI002EFAEAED